MKRLFERWALGALTCVCIAVAHSQPIPPGVAQRTVDIAGSEIELYTYRPEGKAQGGMLITLHGLNRNASGYLRYSREIADRHKLLLIAPRFDRERFPTWRYQHGGIARHSRSSDPDSLQPEDRSQWTAALVLEIVEYVRREERVPDAPYYLLGHSAGGQLLSRLAALVPNTAQRIVIANPSSYVWPSRAEAFPYGFGRLPETMSDDEAIRRYLAQPITIFVGTADVIRDGALNVSEPAMRQGRNRHERGVRVFGAAQALSQEKGWPFNWRLVEAQGVRHSARAMYASPEMDEALANDARPASDDRSASLRR